MGKFTVDFVNVEYYFALISLNIISLKFHFIIVHSFEMNSALARAILSLRGYAPGAFLKQFNQRKITCLLARSENRRR